MFAITEHRSCLRLHRPFSQNLCLICINTAIASSLNYRCKQGLGSKTKAMNYLGLLYLYITDCRAVSTLQACHYRQGCSPIVNLLTCWDVGFDMLLRPISEIRRGRIDSRSILCVLLSAACIYVDLKIVHGLKNRSIDLCCWCWLYRHI